MTQLAQHTTDLRDLFTVINTLVLVLNFVAALYVRSWFKPITQRVERLEAIVESNLKSVMDIRENYMRKSRADEEFRHVDAKLDVITGKVDETREQVAALEGFLKGKGKVCT